MLKYHIRMRDLARHVTKQASVLVVQRLGLILPNGSDVKITVFKDQSTHNIPWVLSLLLENHF